MVIRAEPPPFTTDESGAVRVGASRVLLDVLWPEFERGASPESLAAGYDTLSLAEIYAALAYCLRHRDEVDEYLRRREAEAEALRRQIETTQPPRPGFRDVLLARQAQSGESLRRWR